MPSKDTISFRLTKNTKDELERIRKVISKELGVDINHVTYKQAEIVMRLKSSRGKILVKELNDIFLGKIKWDY